MVFLLYLVVLIPLTQSQTLCMTDFVVLNIDDNNTEYETMIDMCYKNIPNYEEKVFGYNIHTVCYIDDEYITVDSNNTRISRCGEWLSLVGPSQQPINCLVAGTIRITKGVVQDDINRKVIGVSDNVFKRLNANFKGISSVMSQIVMWEIDTDLGINPSMILLSKNDTIANVQFYNFNKCPKHLLANGKLYRLTPDNIFEVPFNASGVFELVSFDNEKIIFQNVNITAMDSGEAISTASRYTSIDQIDCYYVVKTDIYNPDDVTQSKYKAWSFYVSSGNEQLKKVSRQNPVYISNSTDIMTTMFLYPNAFMIAYDYESIEFVFVVNGTYKLTSNGIMYYKETDQINRGDVTLVELNFPMKSYFEKDGKTLHIKTFFRSKSRAFANSFAFLHSLSVGGSLTLKSATLHKRSRLQNQTDCDATSFDCYNVECTPNATLFPNNKIWSAECYPACGSCGRKEYCSEEGKCVKITSKNTRSFDIPKSVMWCVALILVFAL
ncbi:hypothetical protein EIN_129840 [Entamoeba invadens IP1]|uniref:ShKT domain-containing protein n=1 Tax=Entamoeba invadens IP1 TaxID=370355 RepID=L7FN94_ENTIV|nr:hypothetical protein EIN_129840 [Entamoeba invadens IP1]ELP91604.1 hypothetical protein EIN_129840 [Entamoeba invadens IP1]|eukprot:XP_004258375.1 hypothetical protein EIN_129840 [Entamoeba invadens IP1]